MLSAHDGVPVWQTVVDNRASFLQVKSAQFLPIHKTYSFWQCSSAQPRRIAHHCWQVLQHGMEGIASTETTRDAIKQATGRLLLEAARGVQQQVPLFCSIMLCNYLFLIDSKVPLVSGC